MRHTEQINQALAVALLSLSVTTLKSPLHNIATTVILEISSKIAISSIYEFPGTILTSMDIVVIRGLKAFSAILSGAHALALSTNQFYAIT